MKKKKRCVAANEIVVGEKKIQQGIVELIDGEVIKYYPFHQELPMTEWLGGVIDVKTDESGKLKAYWNDKEI